MRLLYHTFYEEFLAQNCYYKSLTIERKSSVCWGKRKLPHVIPTETMLSLECHVRTVFLDTNNSVSDYCISTGKMSFLFHCFGANRKLLKCCQRCLMPHTRSSPKTRVYACLKCLIRLTLIIPDNINTI